MNAIQGFYELAENFCAYLDRNTVSEDSVDILIRYLMRLYIGAMDLPEIRNLEGEKERNKAIPRVEVAFDSCYWEVFNPHDRNDLVASDIVDDLSDIYRDLKDGVNEYEAGRRNNAVFIWKLYFESHWGKHITDLLRVFHQVKTSE